MVDDHEAPETEQRYRVWIRGHRETESHQRTSGRKEFAAEQCRMR